MKRVRKVPKTPKANSSTDERWREVERVSALSTLKLAALAELIVGASSDEVVLSRNAIYGISNILEEVKKDIWSLQNLVFAKSTKAKDRDDD